MVGNPSFSPALKQYGLITANYWMFTLTDGALRMLIVLHFYQLGYAPLAIASLFLFYEIFGVVTNLVGGWLGAKIGLNKTMNTGLVMQIIALAMLAVPSDYLTVFYVMFAQALSGIAKDLNKMSAKSAIKLFVPEDANNTLYRWIALLTGSKNALKGVGFFLGSLLLTLFGFKGAVLTMSAALLVVWIVSLVFLTKDLGKSKTKPKFTELFSKSRSINYLSAARMFLFAARDIWFVIAVPVYLAQSLAWSHWQVGAFMACWIIAYGIVQSIAPAITKKNSRGGISTSAAASWALALFVVTLALALCVIFLQASALMLMIGLFAFGAFFAINSSLHSYLIVNFADRRSVSLDVGFYYMANALGRLLGTILSGYLFQQFGLGICVLVSALFILCSALLAKQLDVNE
ncbi:organoarsenical effux MFS transporter ArsJ [Thalassotalea ganghwensis]